MSAETPALSPQNQRLIARVHPDWGAFTLAAFFDNEHVEAVLNAARAEGATSGEAARAGAKPALLLTAHLAVTRPADPRTAGPDEIDRAISALNTFIQAAKDALAQGAAIEAFYLPAPGEHFTGLLDESDPKP